MAGVVCLFGTWVGMRHFARARATAGSTRYGWLFVATVGTGAALWASTLVSILALDRESLHSGFKPQVATNHSYFYDNDRGRVLPGRLRNRQTGTSPGTRN